MSSVARRRLVLKQIADYLLVGPYAIAPVGAKHWLEPDVRLVQHQHGTGDYEARALFVLPGVFAPARELAVVRKFVWHQSVDRERCRHQVVAWPDVQVQYFLVPGVALEAVDRALKDVQRAVGTLPFIAPGLELETITGKASAPEHLRVTLPREPPFFRGFLNSPQGFVVDLRFQAGLSETFDGLWSILWDLLGHFCAQATQIDMVETYTVDPHEYGRLLAGTLD